MQGMRGPGAGMIQSPGDAAAWAGVYSARTGYMPPRFPATDFQGTPAYRSSFAPGGVVPNFSMAGAPYWPGPRGFSMVGTLTRRATPVHLCVPGAGCVGALQPTENWAAAASERAQRDQETLRRYGFWGSSSCLCQNVRMGATSQGGGGSFGPFRPHPRRVYSRTGRGRRHPVGSRITQDRRGRSQRKFRPGSASIVCQICRIRSDQRLQRYGASRRDIRWGRKSQRYFRTHRRFGTYSARLRATRVLQRQSTPRYYNSTNRRWNIWGHRRHYRRGQCLAVHRPFTPQEQAIASLALTFHQ